MPVPRAGQDARDYAARLSVSLRLANSRLADDKAFWSAVEKEFGAQP